MHAYIYLSWMKNLASNRACPNVWESFCRPLFFLWVSKCSIDVRPYLITLRPDLSTLRPDLYIRIYIYIYIYIVQLWMHTSAYIG